MGADQSHAETESLGRATEPPARNRTGGPAENERRPDELPSDLDNLVGLYHMRKGRARSKSS